MNAAALENMVSNWVAVDSIAAQKNLHPWIVERILLWLEQQLYDPFEDDYRDTWETIVHWSKAVERFERAPDVTLENAFNFLYEKEVFNERHRLIELPTAHALIQLRRTLPPYWYRRIDLRVYQEEFEKQIQGWEL